MITADTCPDCRGVNYIIVDAGAAPCPRCHAEKDLRRRLFRAEVPKRYIDCRLDSYRPANREQAQAAIAVRASVLDGGNPNLLILGAPGVGKSHLAVAALTEHIRRNGRYGLFLSVPEFFVTLADEMKAERRDRYGEAIEGPGALNQAIDTDVLLLDDLGAERPTEYTRDTIYKLLDSRYMHERPLIVTSNKVSEQDLTEHVGERLFSRLTQMCKTVLIVGDDYRMRAVSA